MTAVSIVCWLALFGSARWAFRWPGQTKALRDAFAHGKTAGFLPLFRWEAHWQTPVTELRKQLTCPAVS